MSDELYDEHYFLTHCDPDGSLPYERNEHWTTFFRRIAKEIVHRLQPRTVLDAGCAIGMLVESLDELGVDARGIDVSEYAISQVPDHLRAKVATATLAEPIEGRYDLVTCIEVVEHLPVDQLDTALEHLTAATDQLLLSSTPYDFAESTHVNVQPPEYWSARLADFHFHRVTDFDATFLTPWAALYRRATPRTSELVRDLERERWKLVEERDALRQELYRRSSADVLGGSSIDAVGRQLQDLRDKLRIAIDAAHGADAARARAEARLRHVEYALETAEVREAETGELIERLYDISGGDANRLHALLDARSFRAYQKLLAPYRRLRGSS